MDPGRDTDVYMARGIDSHFLLLGRRFRIAGIHEGPTCTQVEHTLSHTQCVSLACESGVACIDNGRGHKAMVQRRCVQRILCGNIMDKSENPFILNPR